MSIRTYLILSYLALVLLITFGMLIGADLVGNKLRQRNLAFATEGVQKITEANLHISEQILTSYGEFSVEDIGEHVAKELSYLLRGRKSYEYGKMRRDKTLRRLATQEIQTPDGTAGYVDLLDNYGVSVLHPNKDVEGKNFVIWAEQFPEMWRLVARSFKEPKVTGYYSFLDRNNRKRKKFMALVQVPQTPFIVAAVVNIDEYFLPVHEKITQAGREVITQARQSIMEHARQVDRRVKLFGLIGGGLFCLLGAGFGLFFAATISQPLRRLRDGVGEVGEGNFALAVPETGAKEVVQLAHAFNDLGHRLTDYIAKRDYIRDTFGRYVTQEVVKRLLESEEALELGGETREVSILMSDLRGFTAITSDMDPEEVITFLNRYLGKMIEVLTEYQAVIDEILGDGILAFFGAPEPLPHHPAQAVACALAMQQALMEVNAENAEDGLPLLEMGIAVGTGSVVVGNIGSERRTKYSVVGSPVNFTSRMESFALGGQVLISAPTHEQVKDLVEVGDSLDVRMKGVPGSATLYEVRGIGEPYNLRLKERFDALVPLSMPLPVRLSRLRGKVVMGEPLVARITHLCETAATLEYEGELHEWEDVRLGFVDEAGQALAGKIYGKAVSVKPARGNLREAHLRFTSVSPEVIPVIRRLVGEG